MMTPIASPTARLLLAGALLLAAARAIRAGDWPRFRGPNGSGVAETSGLPLEFGPDLNVIWKTPLPPGHSSPILSRDRVFLTALEGESLLTLALDRETGKILWRREAPRPRREKLDSRNHPAAPSPATDGDRVFVFFPEFGLVSYDREGAERWRLPLGPFNNIYGMGASPVVVGDRVVLVCDHATDSFVLAAGKDDGRLSWRTARPEARSGHSTPILRQPAGGPLELIVPGSFLLSGYSAETGDLLWWVGGLSFEMKSTPVLAGDTVYINGYGSPLNQPGNIVPVSPFAEVRPRQDADGDGRLSLAEMPDEKAREWFPFTDLDGNGALDAEEWSFFQAARASTNGILAIRAGGQGDMSASNVRWQYHRSVPQLPSPLLYKNVLYMVNDGGVVTSLNPESGKILAQGRLKGAVDNFFASPVAADDKIFMASESGKVAVLKPDGSLEVLAVNDLDDLCYATPAIADGRLYVRTRNTLYCFGRAAAARER